MNLAPYRKLVAYAVAAILVLVARYAGLDLAGTDDLWGRARHPGCRRLRRVRGTE